MSTKHENDQLPPQGAPLPLEKLRRSVLWAIPIWFVICGLAWYVSSPISSWVDPGPLVALLIPVALTRIILAFVGLPQLGLAAGLFLVFIACIPLGSVARHCFRRFKPRTIAVACAVLAALIFTYAVYCTASRIHGVRMVEAMGGEVRLARLAGEFSFGIPATVCWVEFQRTDFDDHDLDELIRALDKIGVRDCRVDLGASSLSSPQRRKLMNDGPASHLNYSVPMRTRGSRRSN